MNIFKKIILTFGFLLVVLLAFQGSENSIVTGKKVNKNALLSDKFTDSSAFIQPENISHSVTNVKVNIHQSLAKFFENYLLVLPKLELTNIVSAFNFQDINRCNKVSLLLFPYHIFW